MTMEELWALFREEKKTNWRIWLRRGLITVWAILALATILLAWFALLSDRFLVPLFTCTDERIKTIWTICQCLPELHCTWVTEGDLYMESNTLFLTGACCVTVGVILSIIHRVFDLKQGFKNFAWFFYIVAICCFNISLGIYQKEVPDVAKVPGPLTEEHWPWKLAKATSVCSILVFVMEFVNQAYQDCVINIWSLYRGRGYDEI